MKVFLCPNHDILDVHENHLAAGKYFFNIENFTLNNTVKGKIVKRQISIAYEFRFFTFMVMLVKAQSYLARRAKISDSRMPQYSSPVAVKKKRHGRGEDPHGTISIIVNLDRNKWVKIQNIILIYRKIA